MMRLLVFVFSRPDVAYTRETCSTIFKGVIPGLIVDSNDLLKNKSVQEQGNKLKLYAGDFDLFDNRI